MSTDITQNASQSMDPPPPPLLTIMDATKIHEFHVIVMEWITEIHNDFKNGNGYIKPNPQSICGEKFQELVEYMLTKSPELSNIRVQRRQAMTTVWQKLRRILYFILESFLPIFISACTMYMLYTTLTTYTLSPPSTPPPSHTEQQSTTQWFQATIETIETIPGYIGAFVGKLISVTGGIGSEVISSVTGVPHFINKFYATLLTSITGYIMYHLSYPITYIIQETRKATEKKENVFLLQDEFEAEYKTVLAQSLYILFVLPVMNAFDQLLYMSSKSAPSHHHAHITRILDTYSENVTILYHTFLTQHEKGIRLMDPMDILRVSQPSTQFITLMTRLIRESTDELAQQYMLLNQAMLEAPRQMGQVLTPPTLPLSFINHAHLAISSMRNIST